MKNITNFTYAEPIVVNNIEDCAFYHRVELPGVGEVGTQWDLRDVIYDYLGNFDCISFYAMVFRV